MAKFVKFVLIITKKSLQNAKKVAHKCYAF